MIRAIRLAAVFAMASAARPALAQQTDAERDRAAKIEQAEKLAPHAFGDGRAALLRQAAELRAQQAASLEARGARKEAAQQRNKAAAAYGSIIREHPTYARKENLEAALEKLRPSRTQPAERGGPDVTRLRARAMKAYRADDLASACPDFRKITELTPEDGGAWADLGLCLLKAGAKQKGEAATREAARLGDAKTREGAYYNLGKYEVSLEGAELSWQLEGETGEKQCATLAPAPGCHAAYVACAAHWNNGMFMQEDDQTFLVLAGEDREARACAQGVSGDGPDGAGRDCTLIMTSGSTTFRSRFGSSSSQPDGCSLVHADACAGRLGLYCKRWDQAKEGYVREAEERSVAPLSAQP